MSLAVGCSPARLEDATPHAPEVVQSTASAIVQDAVVTGAKETYVRELLPYGNQGAETSIRVQGLERQRGIVQFDQAALVAATGGRPVVEASLELTVQDVSWLWGQIAAHRMKTASTELGATWACANDTNSSTLLQSCTSANAWSMSSLLPANLPYVSSASATVDVNSGLTVARFNVTSDVKAFLAGTQPNRGWLLKVVIEGVPGVVRFRSHESSQPPRLVLDLGCAPTSTTDATCNGIDEDCSGTADEDFVAAATSCGIGACAATGTTRCTAGAVINSCAPRAPISSTDASCNRIDEDCSGTADEDFVTSVTSCGAGACAAVGASVCLAGAVLNTCVPVAHCEGNCGNQNDDDGDHAADCADSDCAGAAECQGEVSDPCTTDQDCQGYPNGHCLAEGASGMPGGYCSAYCNGDSECPSGTDCLSGLCIIGCNAGACDVGEECVVTPELGDWCVPACATHADCSDGRFCEPRSHRCVAQCAADDASCDGVDDDCDDVVDEDFAASIDCGWGSCKTSGALVCSGGVVIDTCVASCEANCIDGHDDDRDGATDCADSECADTNPCTAGGQNIGDGCASDDDCGEGGSCEVGFPGGYCFTPCAEPDTAPNDGCAANAVCWLGSSCVLPCGESDECANPDHACAGLEDLGLPPDPMCRPTCALSCPEPLTCDPVSSVCK